MALAGKRVATVIYEVKSRERSMGQR